MMKTSTLVGCALCFAVTQWAAAAETQYPTRPVRLIVPASAGTGMDYLGRAVSQALTEKYRQQVIVAPLLQTKPPYRPLQDFAPIVLLSSITSVLVVAPGVQAKTVQDFIALLKAHPGQYNYASIGAGSASHLTAEIFNRAAGVNAVHVPFKGVADVYTEMLASRVHYLVWISPASLPMLRDGKLRALAVTSTKRYPGLPDVPTVAEAGLKGAEVDTMIGVVGPATLPKSMVSRLYADFQDVLRRPDTRATFDRQGGEPAVGVTTAQYSQMWKAEYELYRKLLPEIGLKPQ